MDTICIHGLAGLCEVCDDPDYTFSQQPGRCKVLEFFDRLYHKLGNPWGFRWICDWYDRKLQEHT